MNNTQISQFTAKVPDEAKTLFEDLFELQKKERPMLTKGAFFEEMVNAFANPKTVEKTVDNPELLNRLEETTGKLADYKNLVSEIREQLQFTEDMPDDVIVPNIQATQQRAMAVPTEVEVQRPLAENEILFTIPEPHLSLLNATKERLGVSVRDILLDMFLRYTVEQYNQWFYPFVINGSDFENITGKSQKTLKLWLKALDKKK